MILSKKLFESSENFYKKNIFKINKHFLNISNNVIYTHIIKTLSGFYVEYYYHDKIEGIRFDTKFNKIKEKKTLYYKELKDFQLYFDNGEIIINLITESYDFEIVFQYDTSIETYFNFDFQWINTLSLYFFEIYHTIHNKIKSTIPQENSTLTIPEIISEYREKRINFNVLLDKSEKTFINTYNLIINKEETFNKNDYFRIIDQYNPLYKFIITEYQHLSNTLSISKKNLIFYYISEIWYKRQILTLYFNDLKRFNQWHSSIPAFRAKLFNNDINKQIIKDQLSNF